MKILELEKTLKISTKFALQIKQNIIIQFIKYIKSNTESDFDLLPDIDHCLTI